MSSKDNSGSGGIGFLGLLTILFIGLKLTNHIDWSWGLVLLPTLIPVMICVFIMIGFIIYSIFGIVLIIINHAKATNTR